MSRTPSKYGFAAHMGQLVRGIDGQGCHNFYPSMGRNIVSKHGCHNFYLSRGPILFLNMVAITFIRAGGLILFLKLSARKNLKICQKLLRYAKFHKDIQLMLN